MTVSNKAPILIGSHIGPTDRISNATLQPPHYCTRKSAGQRLAMVTPWWGAVKRQKESPQATLSNPVSAATNYRNRGFLAQNLLRAGHPKNLSNNKPDWS